MQVAEQAVRDTSVALTTDHPSALHRQPVVVEAASGGLNWNGVLGCNPWDVSTADLDLAVRVSPSTGLSIPLAYTQLLGQRGYVIGADYSYGKPSVLAGCASVHLSRPVSASPILAPVRRQDQKTRIVQRGRAGRVLRVADLVVVAPAEKAHLPGLKPEQAGKANATKAPRATLESTLESMWLRVLWRRVFPMYLLSKSVFRRFGQRHRASATLQVRSGGCVDVWQGWETWVTPSLLASAWLTVTDAADRARRLPVLLMRAVMQGFEAEGRLAADRQYLRIGYFGNVAAWDSQALLRRVATRMQEIASTAVHADPTYVELHAPQLITRPDAHPPALSPPSQPVVSSWPFRLSSLARCLAAVEGASRALRRAIDQQVRESSQALWPPSWPVLARFAEQYLLEQLWLLARGPSTSARCEWHWFTGEEGVPRRAWRLPVSMSWACDLFCVWVYLDLWSELGQLRALAQTPLARLVGYPWLLQHTLTCGATIFGRVTPVFQHTWSLHPLYRRLGFAPYNMNGQRS